MPPPLPLLATPPRPAASGFRDTALFRPRSVVLAGDRALPETGMIAANLAAGGFRGRLLAVGIPAPPGFEPAAATIAALPLAPDLAVLCLAPERLEPAMVALAARGCFAAIVPVAAPGLAEMTARTGVRALGQGSFGLCVPAIGLNASLAHIAPKPGRLALVAQSAAMRIAVTAAPCSEDSRIRRSALPSVMPKPRSSGSATTVATRARSRPGWMSILEGLIRSCQFFCRTFTTGSLACDAARVDKARAYQGTKYQLNQAASS